jgi:predicted RNA-binding Zn ribbon-like protein
MDAICLDFLNSDWSDYRGSGRKEDRLKKPGWIEQFLMRWSLPVAQPVNEAALSELVALRSLLQRMVQAIAQGHQPAVEDIASLNSYLEAAPFYRYLEVAGETYQVQQMPLHKDWRWVQAEIAISFAELLSQENPARIKKCENADCNWVYYDESRNQSRRWCDEGCANIIKVRRFRKRQREHAET